MKRGAVLFLVGAGVLLSAAGSLPHWNPKAPENGRQLPAFTQANVVEVLGAVGARVQRSGTDAANPEFLATFPNGTKALITLGGCDKDVTCKALNIQSFWTKSSKVPPERTAQAVTAFNQRYAFGKAFLMADGRTTLQYYLPADYGFARGNLAVVFLVFADQAEKLAAEFLRPLERAAP
jgi:hypothetical protein